MVKLVYNESNYYQQNKRNAPDVQLCTELTDI